MQKKFTLQTERSFNIERDEKKITGYTVENGSIVAWDERKHQNKGFIKYQSHPHWFSTTGDPFGDYEKVLNQIHSPFLQEAFHPLVAACPEISIKMEKIVLSKNENISRHIGQTTSSYTGHTIFKDTTNVHTNAHHYEVSVAPGYSTKEGLKLSVSASYTRNSSNNVTISKSKDETYRTSTVESAMEKLSLNTSETAFLNGNVRYINMGTAAIYNCKPTLNFVLGTGTNAETVATVAAKRNTVAYVIFPNQSYPIKEQNAIAFNTNDDFNARPIILNYDQTKKLTDGQVLRIETTQVLGFCGSEDTEDDENFILTFQTSWDQFFPQIFERTACLTMHLKDGTTLVRRVAARKESNYNQQLQPELTIRQAIELAFLGAKIDEKTGMFSYQNLYDYKPELIFDQATNQQIMRQINQNFSQTIEFFNLKLMQGMHISIIPQYSDEKLFNLIKQFFDRFDAHHTFDLIDFDPFHTWQDVWEYFHQTLSQEFEQSDLDRIIDGKIVNQKNIIVNDALKNGTCQKEISFSVGRFSAKVSVNFKNIFDDRMLLDHIVNFLQSFNNQNRFDLSTENNVAKSWTSVIEKIKESIKVRFSATAVSRVKNWEIYNGQETLDESADDKGQDTRHIRFEVGDLKTWTNWWNRWVKMEFKNIQITPVAKLIKLDARFLKSLDCNEKGDTFGSYVVHDNYSDWLKLIDFKKYRQQNYAQFIKKYPNINIDFDSYITHWDGTVIDQVKTTKKYQTKDLFKSDGSETTTTICNFYRREFITGGSQGFTEIHTYFNDKTFYIKTSAHAGGGGNSVSGNFEQAFISLKKIEFY